MGNKGYLCFYQTLLLTFSFSILDQSQNVSALSCSNTTLAFVNDQYYKCEACFDSNGTLSFCRKLLCERDMDTYYCTNYYSIQLNLMACLNICCPDIILGDNHNPNSFTKNVWKQCMSILGQSDVRKSKAWIIFGAIFGAALLLFLMWVIYLFRKSPKKDYLVELQTDESGKQVQMEERKNMQADMSEKQK